eukprot:7385372-Prymnesium_polylepis.2
MGALLFGRCGQEKQGRGRRAKGCGVACGAAGAPGAAVHLVDAHVVDEHRGGQHAVINPPAHHATKRNVEDKMERLVVRPACLAVVTAARPLAEDPVGARRLCAPQIRARRAAPPRACTLYTLALVVASLRGRGPFCARRHLGVRACARRGAQVGCAVNAPLEALALPAQAVLVELIARSWHTCAATPLGQSCGRHTDSVRDATCNWSGAGGAPPVALLVVGDVAECSRMHRAEGSVGRVADVLQQVDLARMRPLAVCDQRSGRVRGQRGARRCGRVRAHGGPRMRKCEQARVGVRRTVADAGRAFDARRQQPDGGPPTVGCGHLRPESDSPVEKVKATHAFEPRRRVRVVTAVGGLVPRRYD